MSRLLEPQGKCVGSVSLIGAGPGAPELLTLKALRLIESAGVVLADQLVSSAILESVPPGVPVISVGKTGHGPSARQDDINALMIALVQAGKSVVRLKSGDPAIFGRSGEEIAALAAAGVAVDIVPGISAAQAAAAALKISLTHRDCAQRFQVVTGHSKRGFLPDDLDWLAMADRRVTTAVYMGKQTIDALATRLIAEGLPTDWPLAVVFDVSRPSQKVVFCCLGDLNARSDFRANSSPCIILIGEVLRVRDRESPSITQAAEL